MNAFAANLASDRLRDHREGLVQLTRQSAIALAAGRLEHAVVWVQIAAHFAWMNHSGVFASSELEGVLEAVAARTTDAKLQAERRPGERAVSRVLHVATQLYQTGGHTQVIRCWVEQDPGREHRVAVTRQGGLPAPEKITEALRGIPVIRLDRGGGGLLARARRLREVAKDADLVVLHTHNYDVVPTLAFHSWPGSPPVVQVDSNDHTFWIGRSGADVVMHMRDSGRALARARRGLAERDSVVVERPLSIRDRHLERPAAKAALGIDADAVVIATAADQTKYRPVGSISFLDLVEPALKSSPRAVLIAAGPDHSGTWAQVAARSGGRVRCLGVVPDASVLHEATDVYVDSFPFSSLTSLLEAGSLGNPVMTFRGHPADCDVLGADTRGLDQFMVAPTSPTEFHSVLETLVRDESRRQELGLLTRQQILSTHTGRGWLTSAEELYHQAWGAPGRIRPQVEVLGAGALDVLVELVMCRTGLASGISGAVEVNAGLLPLSSRVRALLECRRSTGRLTPRMLLSESQLARAAEARRSLRLTS